MEAQQGHEGLGNAQQNDRVDMAPHDSQSGTGTAATDGNLPIADDGAPAQKIAAEDLDIHEGMSNETLVAIARELQDTLKRERRESTLRLEQVGNLIEERALKDMDAALESLKQRYDQRVDQRIDEVLNELRVDQRVDEVLNELLHRQGYMVQ